MQRQGSGFPRIIITALRGGSGKTLLSIGITAALGKRNQQIAPFKKGPDYIDAGWLALAAGRPCYNLDTFLIPQNRVLQAFQSHCHPGDIAVIEGNRGLYDGADTRGSTSTAALAKLLHSPVLLCIDCTKATRTIAAIVLGCLRFDPEVPIKGIILNRIAGLRHETIIRSCIEDTCDIPVVGAIPKLGQQHFPERHMGLVPSPEHSWAMDAIETTADVIERNIDLDTVLSIARSGGVLSPFKQSETVSILTGPKIRPSSKKVSQREALNLQEDRNPPRIGIFRDAAFSFYYPDNIEALIRAGAEPVYVSPLETESLPPVDALYIGGGFPETHGKELAENRFFREQVKALAEGGLPIYAECGGLMFLAEGIVLEGNLYPMVGVFPVVFDISKRPQGHGYTIVRVERENPYYDIGTEIRGHEFHYSRVVTWEGTGKDLVFGMERGKGFNDKKDGLCYKRVLATFTHIHALGTPSWAEAMVENAVYQRSGVK